MGWGVEGSGWGVGARWITIITFRIEIQLMHEDRMYYVGSFGEAMLYHCKPLLIID